MLRLSPGKKRLEWRPLSARIARSADTVQNDGFLQLRFFVGDFKASQGSDNGFTFFEAIAREEPARGFREPKHDPKSACPLFVKHLNDTQPLWDESGERRASYSHVSRH